MTKCSCEMTSLEILEQHLAVVKPNKSVLIVDGGQKWSVTMFGPDNAGLGTEHITIQSAIQAVEECLANLRRQADTYERGEIITDPQAIVDAIAKDHGIAERSDRTN